MALTPKDLKAIKQIVSERNFNDRNIKAIKKIVNEKTLSDKDFERMEESIGTIFDQKIEEKHLVTLEDINHLLTKDEFFKKEDEVLTELQKLREEVSVTTHQYKRTNKRVDLIDDHLGISTSDLA